MCKIEIDPMPMNNSCLCHPQNQEETLSEEDQRARLERYRSELQAVIASAEETIGQMKKEEGEEDV